MEYFYRFLIGVVAGFIYVYFFTHILAPINLEIKGKHLHHNLRGALMGIFVVVPLIFFFYVLNFDMINFNEGLKLGASIFGLIVGSILEHKIVHGEKKK